MNQSTRPDVSLVGGGSAQRGWQRRAAASAVKGNGRQWEATGEGRWRDWPGCFALSR